MTRLLKNGLLGLLCLLGAICPASSQPAALHPLPPLVVRIDSGTTLHRPLVGIDPNAYEDLRNTTSLDQRQLAERAAQIAQLRALQQHDSLSTMRVADELAATRLDNAALQASLFKQEQRTQKLLALPLRPPWLVDNRFWVGTGIGAAAVVLLKAFVVR